MRGILAALGRFARDFACGVHEGHGMRHHVPRSAAARIRQPPTRTSPR